VIRAYFLGAIARIKQGLTLGADDLELTGASLLLPR
jgi:hypothetical protein